MSAQATEAPALHDQRLCASQRLVAGVVTVPVPENVTGATHVQTGVCIDCRQIIVRRYVVTGPLTGEWVTL